MADAVVIGITKLSDQINKELARYSHSVSEQVKKSVDEISKEMFDNIKRDAPKKIGYYIRAMRLTTSREDLYSKSRLFYLDKGSGKYRIAHLLEHGHVLRSGGRTRAFPHIKKNEQTALNKFLKQIEEIIENGRGQA